MIMNVNIVIPSFEDSSKDVLNQCLRSINDGTTHPHSCVVVRSQASAAANRNVGLAKATEPLICLMDDDVIVHAGWLTRLVETYEKLGPNAAIAPKILMSNQRLFCLGMRKRKDGSYSPIGFNQSDTVGSTDVVEVDLLPTTCVLMSRERAVEVGGFDEEFQGSQWEDVDFGKRLAESGSRFFVDVGAVVTHENLFRNSRYATNERYYEKKWHQSQQDETKTS